MNETVLTGTLTEYGADVLNRLIVETRKHPPVVYVTFRCECRAAYLQGTERIVRWDLCPLHDTEANRSRVDAALMTGEELRALFFPKTCPCHELH